MNTPTNWNDSAQVQAWADKQVEMYTARFDARLADYMRSGAECSAAALLEFANKT